MIYILIHYCIAKKYFQLYAGMKLNICFKTVMHTKRLFNHNAVSFILTSCQDAGVKRYLVKMRDFEQNIFSVRKTSSHSVTKWSSVTTKAHIELQKMCFIFVVNNIFDDKIKAVSSGRRIRQNLQYNFYGKIYNAESVFKNPAAYRRRGYRQT